MTFGPKSTIKKWWLEPRPMVGEKPILTTEERIRFVDQALDKHCREPAQLPDTILYFMMDKPDFPKHSPYDSRVMIEAIVLAKDAYVREFKRQEEAVAKMHSRADIYG